MNTRIKVEENLLKYLEWYHDIDTENGYTISITSIREYLDTVLCTGWEDIEKFMAAMTECGIPYENQVEMIKTLAKSIELWKD